MMHVLRFIDNRLGFRVSKGSVLRVLGVGCRV